MQQIADSHGRITTVFGSSPGSHVTTTSKVVIRKTMLSLNSQETISPQNVLSQIPKVTTFPSDDEIAIKDSLENKTTFRSTEISNNFNDINLEGSKNIMEPKNQMSSHLHMHSASTSTLPIRMAQPPTLYPSSYSTTMLPNNSNSNSQYSIRNNTNQSIRNTSVLRTTPILQNKVEKNFSTELKQQDLLNNLETQRQKIITNETEIEQRRALLNAYNKTVVSSKQITPSEKARYILSQRTKLQSDIMEGEHDLHRMISAHKNLIATEEANNAQRQKLSELKEEAEMCGQNLREAVGKADYLKQRLEQLLQKRASAASAAIAQQRKINGVSDVTNSILHPTPTVKSLTFKNSGIFPNKPLFNSNCIQRPQASVEPFSVKNKAGINSIYLSPSQETKKNLNNKDFSDNSPKLKDVQRSNGKCSGYESIASDTSSLSGIEEQNKLAATYKTDQLVVRSDTLKAAKRRSLVQSETNGESETENIWRLLVEEQKKGKGKTHITFSDLFSNRDKNKTTQNNSRSPSEESNISNKNVPMTEDQILKAESSDEAFVEEFNSIDKDISDDESNQAKKLHIHGITIAPSESSSCASDDSLAHIKSVDIYDSTSEQSISPPIQEVEEDLEEITIVKPTKSILKTTSSSTKGHIHFDPLVLFLDGALEGQLDTVMENAEKVADVSQPNEEGITALHNAICAGYIEVVEYLISKKADVNAQDSDGWTPLHCAASCNSLLISRILIESGACLYSHTLSDLEIPEHKLETEEDFYNECLLFFTIVGKCMGLLNDCNVYACYDYDANCDDELSFKKNDILKVLSKPEDEKFYWLCESRKSGEKGLIPRNFVSLYPSISLREEIDFKPFNLPTSLEMCDKLQDKFNTAIQRPKISPPLPPKL
ncbi:SH3 domain and Ankyrin repeat and Ankyrin repeat-containing domain-containing protein [Strongyloides ratti]|uniref:SH3 domain and Ankyrin repeat and Ankyrin repeat-containing domain-containing protein n=1 Tax=Strongyloides ratti TaxID=34506 RepID=A0A090L159_STRRB|nr:SH3 domain and Ankyrin repeat and Ankyrin repeat-containing domain-containing protein [Strongyloides ratti]CEF63436.1 SH3 domain and Ankyrin repeat and Ankyrin repeat-containing domain-containing protein [Strongyloides ratti]